jgi:hypothetical protein
MLPLLLLKLLVLLLVMNELLGINSNIDAQIEQMRARCKVRAMRNHLDMFSRAVMIVLKCKILPFNTVP